ncbi:MAG: PAS domain S-box protein [Aestuariivirga sp.]
MTSALFNGWDELRNSGQTWRVEKPSAPVSLAPFFPDQNGGVYETLLSNLPVMLHCMDGSGRMISANAAWCHALGYAPTDIIGRSFSELLPPESRSKLVTEIYPRFLVSSTYRNAEILIHRKDRSLATVLMSMTAYRGDKGRLERSVCLLEDITEKKIASMASGRSDQRFRAAFNASAYGMAIVSPSGQIELVNDALCDFLLRPTLPSAAFSFEELINREDRNQFINAMHPLLSGQVPSSTLTLRYRRSDGKVVEAATSVLLVKGEKGEIQNLVVQLLPATPSNVSDVRMAKAQKMEAIGQLTGGLAHDFNNLLTVIIGNLQLLDGKFAPEDKSARRVSEAIDAAQKGSDLTRQLLAIAKKQDLSPRDVEVNSLLAGMEALVSRSIGENIELKVDLVAGETSALIDPSQLESAILNLAINARDAMPNGGRLTIESQSAHLDQFYAEKNPGAVPGDYIMVAVSDSGEGMSAETLEQVFQPFFTTKPQGMGTGLGLSMVYGFIKQSGGHISIYSELGHGTSVKMYLPRRKPMTAETAPTVTNPAPEPIGASTPAAPVAAPPIAPTPAPVAVRKPKLLVVEDQEAVRAVACGFLEGFGYEVIEAGDGFEALAKLQENIDIDLMFSDVVMPGGMNGFDLAQAAQSLRPDLKVVHTSGYPKGAMVHQDEPRFKNGFIIMKPYRRDELQKIIKDALEKQ